MIKEAKFEELSSLYDSFIEPYFPEAEKKPLKSIQRMVKTGLYKVYYLEDEGKAVGVAFLTGYPGGNTYLLDYLAVDRNSRLKGYGGTILKECKKATEGKMIIIETESLESATSEDELNQRIKRNRFYSSNGVVRTEVKTSVFGVEYDNWILGEGTIEPETIKVCLRDIYRFMVNDEEKFEKFVII